MGDKTELTEGENYAICKAAFEVYGPLGYAVGQHSSRITHEVERVMDVRLAELAEVRAERDRLAREHRDLTSRLGFGNGITEPQADNDTIVAFYAEQGRDADEWREHQSWLNDCAAAGCDSLEDCAIHAPACHPARRDRLAAQVSAVEAVVADYDAADQVVRRSSIGLGTTMVQRLHAALASPPVLAEHDAECPTLCDDDCDADCHEVHLPSYMRDHQPDHRAARIREAGR